MRALISRSISPASIAIANSLHSGYSFASKPVSPNSLICTHFSPMTKHVQRIASVPNTGTMTPRSRRPRLLTPGLAMISLAALTAMAAAQVDPRAAERHPLVVPLRFHVEMLGRNTRRQGGAAMPAEECREPCSCLQDGVKRDHPGPGSSRASSKARGSRASCPPAAKSAAPPAPAISQAAPKPPRVQKPVAPAPAAVAPPAPPSAPAPPALSRQEEDALVRQNCSRDFLRHCRGVQLGEGRAIACLSAYEPSLSDACRATLRVVGLRR